MGYNINTTYLYVYLYEHAIKWAVYKTYDEW